MQVCTEGNIVSILLQIITHKIFMFKKHPRCVFNACFLLKSPRLLFLCEILPCDNEEKKTIDSQQTSSPSRERKVLLLATNYLQDAKSKNFVGNFVSDAIVTQHWINFSDYIIILCRKILNEM